MERGTAKRINLPQDYLNRVVASIVSVVPAEAIYIFGSYARGEESVDSDLDLYIVTQGAETERFEQMGKIGRSLLWMGMPKDILVGSHNRFDKRKNNMTDIEYVVHREGIKVYG